MLHTKEGRSHRPSFVVFSVPRNPFFAGVWSPDLRQLQFRTFVKIVPRDNEHGKINSTAIAAFFIH